MITNDEYLKPYDSTIMIDEGRGEPFNHAITYRYAIEIELRGADTDLHECYRLAQQGLEQYPDDKYLQHAVHVFAPP